MVHRPSHIEITWYQVLSEQVCVQPSRAALDTTLLAFAAERRGAGRPLPAAVDRCLLPAANPPHAAAAIDRLDRHTDIQTGGHPTDA